MRTDHSSPRPGFLDPSVVRAIDMTLGPAVRHLWPSELFGIEHIPTDDRFLLVANHSGMGIAELWALLLLWHRRFGGSRPVAGMAHPGAFRIPGLRHVLQSLGAVEATHAGAEHARAHGVPLILFPGGDHEATRPIWEANRVDFAGRTGWVRLAREHGLSIVPMCITGSHITLPILAHGRALSWLIGTRAFGIHRAPLPALAPPAAAVVVAAARALGAPWPAAALAGWASVWLTMVLPWIPSRIGFHVLPEIPACGVASASDAAIYDVVVRALQSALSAHGSVRTSSSVRSAGGLPKTRPFTRSAGAGPTGTHPAST